MYTLNAFFHNLFAAHHQTPCTWSVMTPLEIAELRRNPTAE